MEWDRWAAQRASSPEAAAGGGEDGGAERRLQMARVRRLIQRRAARAEAAPRDPGASFDAATRGASAELPHRREMERAFGASFAGVRVHLGQREPMAALGAHAATEGQTIAFAEASPDRKLVAHELTHVMQNRGHGGASIQRSAEVSHPGDAAEHEADANAERVAAGEAAEVQAAPSTAIHRLGETEGKLRERLDKLELAMQGAIASQAYAQLDELVDQLLALKQLAHENNYGALANQINGKLPEWSSTVDSVDTKEWPKEKRQHVEARLGSVGRAAASYNKLGRDKWREFIDGKDHDHGAECYDKGSNGGGQDHGWLASEKLADQHVGTHLGEHLDVEEYARIHDLAVQHSKKHEGFRDSGHDIGVPTRDTHRDPAAVGEMGPDATVDITGASDERGVYRATHTPMPRAEVQGRVQEALDEYYFSIGRAQTPNEKLRVITQVHQKLERLHAFMDGTGRTDHFVLNRFLVENGFCPVILADQNEVNHSTAATWQEHIERGMESWLSFASKEEQQPSREGYDQEMWMAMMQRQMLNTEDPHEGRALPQVAEERVGREKWMASRKGGSASPKSEEDKTAEEKQEVAEAPQNPLHAEKVGRRPRTQQVLDLAIASGFKSLSEVKQCWWGDFKPVLANDDEFHEVLVDLGLEDEGLA